MANLINLRELGRIPAGVNVQVSSHTIYRSAAPDLLKVEVAREAVADLGVRTILDLRSERERGRAIEFSSTCTHHVDLSEAAEGRIWESSSPPDDLVVAAHYLDLASTKGPELRAVVEVVAKSQAPMLIHCQYGKDRTSVVVAVLLALLGAADRDIAHDFALSETQYHPMRWARLRRREIPPPRHWRANPLVILHFMSSLRDRFGSVDSLATEIGIPLSAIADLRCRFVEPRAPT